ncbi:MAG: fumarylacetoacetate hydrolase family protein [Candidatus Melainabacteria bacterium]|nr:fumarylacetoacetate hydrolase family protein [Candidatus Melainabacteria bacterium]
MRFVTFTTDVRQDSSIGVVLDNRIMNLNKASDGAIPNDMLSFISGGEKMLELAHTVVKNPKHDSLLSLDEVKLLTPLLNPPSLKDFFAFEDHAKAGAERRNEKLPSEWYEVPAYYTGNHREILGPEDEIPWPLYTKKLDFECEIACVVGKHGKNLSIEEASNYIFGYMIFNDVSARDVQKKEMALRMGPTKGKDFANVFGPYLVTKDEVDPKKDFALTVKVNNEIWSSGHFKDQYWGFPLMISHVSQEENIYPGDILGSGTFYKGCGLDLNKWIQPGDLIELEVPKLGVLRNRVGVPSKYKELDYKRASATK